MPGCNARASKRPGTSASECDQGGFENFRAEDGQRSRTTRPSDLSGGAATGTAAWSAPRCVRGARVRDACRRRRRRSRTEAHRPQPPATNARLLCLNRKQENLRGCLTGLQLPSSSLSRRGNTAMERAVRARERSSKRNPVRSRQSIQPHLPARTLQRVVACAPIQRAVTHSPANSRYSSGTNPNTANPK